MKLLTRVLLGCVFSAGMVGLAPARLNYSAFIEEIDQLHEKGALAEADRRVQETLEKESLKPEQRNALEYELERSRRIRRDYPLTEKKLIKSLKEGIRDFRVEEFRQWEQEERFDRKMIDGEKRFVRPSRSNLFFRYPELRSRRITPAGTKLEDFLWNHYQEILAEYRRPAQSTVKPRRFQLKMTITVEPDAVPKGQAIRCWMPYPQQFEAQSDVRLLSATPEVSWINAPRYPMRSLYFEQPSAGDGETVFQADYLLTTYPRYNPIDPARISMLNRMHPEFGYFLRQKKPHVLFEPQIIALAREIVGAEHNPYVIARQLYDWMSENIQYSYAREYSTLRNISLYTCTHRYGDCGQQALLFITLCRSQGIPARLQSGWVLYPMLTDLHDWVEIYLEPYGWIPVDVNFAQMIEQDVTGLTREQKNKLKDFYFGGLDAYRLVVNSDHGYPHYPGKESFRSDDVDFQRGELESGGKNLYFDQFDYALEVEYLDESDS